MNVLELFSGHCSRLSILKGHCDSKDISIDRLTRRYRKLSLFKILVRTNITEMNSNICEKLKELHPINRALWSGLCQN